MHSNWKLKKKKTLWEQRTMCWFLLFVIENLQEMIFWKKRRSRNDKGMIKKHASLFSLFLVLRYIHALYLGAQSRWHGNGPSRHFHWRLMFESADITMLRLLEAFLKSAPQLVLQLSIMIHGNTVLPLQGEWDAVPASLWEVWHISENSL